MDGSRPVTTPFGLRVVDTRTWTARTIDAVATDVVPAGSVLVAPHDGAWTVWGLDGKERYRVTLPRGQWLSVQGRYAYVCRSRDLVRILDAATGATARRPRGRSCVSLLLGSSSAW